MGKDSTPTASGTYILVCDRAHDHGFVDLMAFRSTRPTEYRTEVNFATQMSYTGVFVHSAPWSVGAQGHTKHSPAASTGAEHANGSSSTPSAATSSRCSTRSAALSGTEGSATGTSVGSVARRQCQGVTPIGYAAFVLAT